MIMDNFLDQDNVPVFERIKQVDEKGEYWSARDLAKVLQYPSYDKFKNVGNKAWEACKNAGQNTADHFSRMGKMVQIGSQATRELEDVRLSRYACYLVVQNADPEKEVVALGQSYFAIQTRIQEIQQMQQYAALKSDDEKRVYLRHQLAEHSKHLMSAAKGAGVIDQIDYAIFQNFGYKGLYGGLDKTGIQKKMGLPGSANISDFMGSTELAANLFRATQTEEKLKKEGTKGKAAANQVHYEVGRRVRQAIKDIGGTMPEDLPAAENIKKVESRIKKTLKDDSSNPPSSIS
jgi:DNA-damage-inducible protein D